MGQGLRYTGTVVVWDGVYVTRDSCSMGRGLCYMGHL